jgi:uncharacterized protein (TIGR03790 family)
MILILKHGLGLFLLLMLSNTAFATPGPDSTLLVINTRSETSVRIANYYANARHIPSRLQCEVEIDPNPTVTHQVFYDDVVLPVLDCVMRYREQIEAIVLTRGTPLRVQIEIGDLEQIELPLTISSASLLTVAQSTLEGLSLASPVHAGEYAELLTCGDIPCWSPRIINPWRYGHFSPRWYDINQGIQWAPLWVSRLDGYSESDSLALVDRALASEREEVNQGVFVLMAGADVARGVLDVENEDLKQALLSEGSEVLEVPFNSDLIVESPMMALVTGSAHLAQVIEGNTYSPGAITDNLTSFAAHPNNFDLDQDEVQASISRWVQSGVSGVHGTTDEPLNIAFPSRAFLLDYRKGSTLVEAFSRHIPFLAWQNLILGDPMMAPYMNRPTIEIESLENGEVRLMVQPGINQRLQTLTLWDSEDMIARYNAGEQLSFCSSRAQQILAVAQVVPIQNIDITDVDPSIFGDGFASGYAKGWRTFTVPVCGMAESTMNDMAIDTGMNLELDLNVSPKEDLGLDGQIDEVSMTNDLEPEEPFTDQSLAERDHTAQGCVQQKRQSVSFIMGLFLLCLTIWRAKRVLSRSVQVEVLS